MCFLFFETGERVGFKLERESQRGGITIAKRLTEGENPQSQGQSEKRESHRGNHTEGLKKRRA